MAAKKLYKSKENKMIAGVCGGLAEYLDMDPTIVRALTVAFVFFAGTGILAYIIMACILPAKPDVTEQPAQAPSVNAQPDQEYTDIDK